MIILRRYELNQEEWILWLTTAWIFYLFPEFNLSELFEELGGGDLEGYDLDLLFPHPYRVVEAFTYDGEESIMIDNDVVFTLYFSSHLRLLPKFKDNVKVGLYSVDTGSLFPLPKLIKNSTAEIKPRTSIKRQQITIENLNYTLESGVSLLFSIEIIPGNKWISNLLGKERPLVERFAERLLNWLENQENNSKRPKLADLGAFIKDVRLIAEDLNITTDDLAEILVSFNAFSSSFIYDSVNHPSSVTIPFTLPGDENTKVYYLHDGNQMDEEKPENDQKEEGLSESPVTWDGPNLERSKILKTATASLYLTSKYLLKKTVTATLYNGEEEIAFNSQEVKYTSFLTPKEPIIFTFNDIDEEIVYGESLSLGVSLGNGSKTGPIRKVKLLYNSEEYPSFLTVRFEETDNIQFEYVADPEDELIVPGDEVEYTLNITSKYTDDIDIDVLENKVGDWTVTIEEDLPLNMTADSKAEVHISVKSDNDESNAYGDTIDLTFIVSGKTGLARQKAFVEVSEEAIEYDVEIIGYTESKNIKKGGTGIFYFVIKNNNTGAVDDTDSYTITATSKNGWDTDHTESITDLKRGDKTGSEEVLVYVSVPKNTSLDSDIITFTVTSDGNNEAFATVNVTVDVMGTGIFDSIYKFLESVSESLGLDDVFGDNAPYVLAAIIIIIILLVIIIPVLVLRRKFVEVVCTDRIKEIDPDGEAVFEITINNPKKKTQTYEISPNGELLPPKWETSIDPERVTLNTRESQTVLLTVKPTDIVEPKEWTEVKLKVNKEGKKKSQEISTMVMIKEGKTLLKIANVFTWPKEFNDGDRVITSFRLENNGSISARNVKVILFINGKQKNKVEVTIPSGGFADIKMPWIAVKGKNKLLIKAVEQ